MVRPTRFVHGGLVLLLAVCGWLLICFSARAFADPYTPPVGSATEPALEGLGSCSSGPLEPYEGEDEAAGEARALRLELVELCNSVTKRADEVAHRVWWLIAEALAAKDQRVSTNTLLSEVRDRLASPIGVEVQKWSDPDPVPTDSAAAAEYSDELVSAVDASGNATKEALWFLSGLLVMLAGSALYRHLKP